MSSELRALQNEPFRLLTELAARLHANAPESSASDESQSWLGLGFRLAERWFLAPRGDMREILRPMPYTRIPGAKPWLFGLANVRGNLLPLIDLRRFLGLPAAPVTRSTRLLVFSDERIPAGFMVDEVAGFRRFGTADQRHELIQDDIGRDAAWAAPYLLGAFVREGQGWPVFSLVKLVHSPEFQNAGL